LPLVDQPKQRVGEERKQLDKRDAGVTLVGVGPLRAVDSDPANDLVPQLLVAAIVEEWRG
jgi:hypothetical protein